MGVLPDWMIKRDVGIEPFAPAEKREGRISYGVTSYGYDVRLGYKFRVFKPYPAEVIDPKNFNPKMLEEVDLSFLSDATGNNAFILIPPHSFVLGESLERFRIPRDVVCLVVGKSTYARCGLIVNVTPGEPEWEGHWTIELSNTTPLPMKVYAGEGIMQCLFFRSDGWREWILNKVVSLWWEVTGRTDARPEIKNPLVSCDQSYADKKGKYSNQPGLTLPKVD